MMDVVTEERCEIYKGSVCAQPELNVHCSDCPSDVRAPLLLLLSRRSATTLLPCKRRRASITRACAFSYAS